MQMSEALYFNHLDRQSQGLPIQLEAKELAARLTANDSTWWNFHQQEIDSTAGSHTSRTKSRKFDLLD